MKKVIILFLIVLSINNRVFSQEIDFENFDLRQLMGKVLAVKKGYSPKFFIGKSQIPKLDVVAEILGSKRNPEINRLFKTFKTGRTIYKVATYTGTAVAVYGVVKNTINSNKDSISNSAKDAAMTAVYSGAGTILSGVVVKLLTKGASYKAVDLFGGVIRKNLGDVLGIDLGMIRQYNGAPALKAGVKIAL